MSISTTKILNLYKQLLRYGSDLEYTNKGYYFRKIRHEFKTNKNLTDPKEISFNYKKGLSLLERQSVK
ncbi:mitochondrial ribosome and complex I assembly factor AltMIEF1 [Onthophagus taurus]|uniref:mitochondrial ribosome and complex I assembly factor AltMIEF1 n=1 Tax=Onthophagus taurus TaxID=166361 RepID=UPI0039BDAE9A